MIVLCRNSGEHPGLYILNYTYMMPYQSERERDTQSYTTNDSRKETGKAECYSIQYIINYIESKYHFK
jgi:hypothetical protein